MKEIEKQIAAPKFLDIQYIITEYGAKGDGISDALPAIKQAMDVCSFNGGGKVVIPKGKYFSKGPIVLKSNVNLHLEDGAEILFSPDEKDYLPAVLTRWEGTEVYNYSPMIYAYNVKNIALTGKGIINGQGSKNIATWKPGQKKDQTLLRKMGTEVRPVYERVFGEGHVLRPAMIEFFSCSNVLIEGIKIIDGTFWTIHPIYCSNVIIRGLEVDSPVNDNSDGIDPESCYNVLIENCLLKTLDDGIAIKSGRDNDAWRVGQPSENIIIRNCVLDSRINGVCIGSEISGGVRNVFIENITIVDCKDALYFKSNLDRGGYIQNVHVRNVNVKKCTRLIKFEPDYKSESKQNWPTQFKGFTFKNIHAENASVSGIDITGFECLPVEDVSIENLTVKSTPVPLIIKNVKNVLLKKVKINGEIVSLQ
jgi:polygalacturonase